MGRAIDTPSGFVTNQTGLTAVTVSPGDSLTVRSAPFGSGISLQGIWGKQATAGAARVRSPRMHDFVNGLRFPSVGTTPRDLTPDEFDNLLYPQDPLTVELTSGAADSSALSLQIYYENLPGIDASLRTWDEVHPQIDQYVDVEVDVTGSATIGSWGPGDAISSDNDQFKVNRLYAVLGFTSSVAVASVALRGSDSGNLRVAGPGATEFIETRDYFVQQTRRTMRPYLLVFNSANRSSVLVDVVSNTASPAPNLGFLLALLKESG